MARLLFVWLLLAPVPALAHKLNVFAHADGATIAGHAYFTGGIAARQADVVARDSSGRELGRAKTDDNGEFTYLARARIDHHLTAETPDGHASTPFIVTAAELPDSLPGASAAPAPQPASAGESTSSHDVAAESKIEPCSVSVQIKALQTQIELLRSQIDESEQRLRFRDILGGIGYILGLAGIALYMKTRHKRAI